jgi:hypothetical protein
MSLRGARRRGNPFVELFMFKKTVRGNNHSKEEEYASKKE